MTSKRPTVPSDPFPCEEQGRAFGRPRAFRRFLAAGTVFLLGAGTLACGTDPKAQGGVRPAARDTGPVLTYRATGNQVTPARPSPDPFPGRCDPSLLRLRSECACVVDLETGGVLYQKNAGKLSSIASITKLMTAMVVLDAKFPPGEPITITADDVDTLRHSRSHLPVGWCLTREQLVQLALMSSENRAAHAVARAWPGGVNAFVAAMNDKAGSLGLIHTHFEDPTGLYAGNVSTAADLARMLTSAYAYERIREWSTAEGGVFESQTGGRARTFRNSDRLVHGGKYGIELSKTGYIIEAGYCLVTVFRVNGRAVACALLNAPRSSHRFSDTVLVRKWLAGEKLTVAAPKASKKKAPKTPAKGSKKKTKKK
ncbi:MAG: serine hydrolase [Acidobacteria bacterium]|nr:serine hydrolase [Acidobacteriota bacterium]